MRAKVIGYIIKKEETVDELLIKVQEAIGKGWQPVGGVAIDLSISPRQYLQALVLWSEPDGV
jgi:hypothetical protein